MGERRVTADGRILEKLPDGTIIEVPQTPQQGAIPIGPRKTEATPSGYRRRPDGALEPIPGGPAIKTSYRQLTPSEAASRGLPPLQEGQFYQVSSEGSISVVGAPQRDRAYRPLPDSAAKRYEDSVSGYANLDRAISTFNPDYAGNTITGGLENSIQRRFDSFGTKGQAQWWADVNATDNALRNALFGASLTAGEQAAWDRTSIDPSMDPAQVKRNLEQRREIARGALSRKTAFLKANGYDPNAVNALAGEYAQNLSGQNIPQVANAMDQTYFMNDQREAVGFGEDMRRTSVPPELQAEWQGYMAQNFNGQMDPDAYARFRMGLDQKYNYGTEPGREQLYREEAQRFNDYYNRGGRTIVPIPGRMEKMSTLDVLKNSLANNPVTVTAANAADAATLGIPSLIDRTVGPGNMELLNNANPKSALFGQVVGSLAGTSGLGAAGKAVTSRLAPKLLGGEGGAALARGLATDGAYSGIYGANTGQDPLLSAITGVGGSALGHGVGKTLGTVVGGVVRSPMAQTLVNAKIPLTAGQSLGGLAKATEDRLMSVPWVGDAIRNRRLESFQGFNRAAFDEAGRPINATVTDIGEDGLRQLMDQVGSAHDNVTAGVSMPLDANFGQDVAGVASHYQKLPPAARANFAQAMDNTLNVPVSTGQLTGETYQNAMRSLKGYKGNASKAAGGFDDEYRAGMSAAQNALKGQMMRGGGAHVVEGLNRANQAYRLAKVLENAQNKAINGTGSGATSIFTPAQLNAAALSSVKRFPGSRPFADLAKAGQEVLPSKIPDSGTSGRLSQMMLPAILGGGGYAAGDGTGLASGLALAGMLRFGASKIGQDWVNKALFSRGEGAKALGAAINKRKGLFGAATIPFTLETQN